MSALGEHDPAVDDEDAVLDLEAEAVAPDLAETAEEDDPDRRGAHRGSGYRRLEHEPFHPQCRAP